MSMNTYIQLISQPELGYNLYFCCAYFSVPDDVNRLVFEMPRATQIACHDGPDVNDYLRELMFNLMLVCPCWQLLSEGNHDRR